MDRSGTRKIRTKPRICDASIHVRMPIELKRDLEERADANGRSRSAEIVVRLNESLRLEDNQEKSRKGNHYDNY